MAKTKEYILVDTNDTLPLSIRNKIKHPKIKRMLSRDPFNYPLENCEGLVFITDNQIFYTYYTTVQNRPLLHFYEFCPETQRYISYNNSGNPIQIKVDLNFYKQFDTTSTLMAQESYHEQAL